MKKFTDILLEDKIVTFSAKELSKALGVFKTMDDKTIMQIYKSTGTDTAMAETASFNSNPKLISLRLTRQATIQAVYKANIYDKIEGIDLDATFFIDWDGKKFTGDF